MYFEEALMVARQGAKVAKRSWDRSSIDYLYYGDSEDGTDSYIGFYMKVREGDGWKHYRLESIASKLKIQGYFDEWYITNFVVDEESFNFLRLRKDIADRIDGIRAQEKLKVIEEKLVEVVSRLDTITRRGV